MREPTFSLKVREELARSPVEKMCCCRAEWAGLTLGCGRLHLSSGGRRLIMVTRQPFVARRIVLLARRLGRRGRLMLARGGARAREFQFELAGPEAAVALREAGMIHPADWLRRSAPPVPRSRCCRRAWLRGLFLSAGSVSRPGRGRHLEFDLPSGTAESCERLLTGMGLPVRRMARRDGWCVYLKESGAIAELLQELGANEGRLAYEEAMIRSGRRNEANRLVNAETANLDKAAQASVRQVEAIRRLAQHPGLAALPQPLRQLAEARLREPELSLRELGERLHPPLGKSGVNHRMRRLIRLAEAQAGPVEQGTTRCR